jgi:hypothetical protein
VSDPNPQTDATRVAIEFLTLWIEPDHHAAVEHIGMALHDPNGPGPVTAITGLLNLSMILAVALARASGADDTRAWALQYLRNLSTQLPKGEWPE